MALVHTPVPIGKAMKIPAARKAVHKEWESLMDQAWDLSTVRPRQQVIAQTKHKEVHFAVVMALCHQKHSERRDLEAQYKGRVVLRGDKVKDETGEFAVFSEMGTSASQLSATKSLDAIARLPGNTGQNSDAVKAYRQVVLKDMAERLNVPYVETWVSFHSNVRPKSW